METKKITQEQLEQLFAFTRKHFVEYHDLQAELADHLANAIEDRWKQQPALSFNEALQFEFKKFGIFGFSEIVEQRQNALFKKYYMVIWHEFAAVFNFRIILLSALAVFVIYEALIIFPRIFAVLLLLFFGISSYKLWRLRKQYKKRLSQTGRKWLFEELIYNCGGLGVMMWIPVQLIRYIMKDAFSPVLAAIMALLLVLIFIYDYIALFRMPSRAETHLQKVYPEYRMEKFA